MGARTGRATRATVAFGLVCLVVAAAAVSLASSAAASGPQRRRVLVITVPGLTWQVVRGHPMPNLARLFAVSAVGDLATRTADGPATIGSGYATIGAGARAAGAPSTADSAYGPAERYGSGTAQQEFARRTGLDRSRGVVYLGLTALEGANGAKLFDAHVGALGDALSAAGVHRAVVGNADAPSPNPLAEGQIDRNSATAIMRSDGTVAAGRVDNGLLVADPSFAYGVKLDRGQVVRAFDQVWRDRSVVLVEASDLARADLYGQYATASQRSTLMTRALRSTDALVGQLLDHVDLSRDTVMVVTPSHPSGPVALGVVSLHAPGVDAAYLRSPTMRRGGFAAMVDVAPTILDRLGIDRPTAMEGRPMVVTGSPAPLRARIDHLATADVDGQFRDRLVDTTQNVLLAIGAVVALALVLGVRTGKGRRVLGTLALVALAFPTTTYLAAPFHFASHGGTSAYTGFVVVATGVLAALYALAGRLTRTTGVEVALGVILVLHLLDAVSGGHLEFNTPLGYSATVGIRIAGLGNPTFAQVGAAAVLLAGLAVVRSPRFGRRLAFGLLGVTFVVLAAPFFGQSFGAALATAPAFALFAWLVSGRELKARHGFALAGLLVVAGLVVGFVDLLRPGADQTHIGLFFSRVGTTGSGGFFTVLHRKLDENVASFQNRAWVWLAVICAATLVWLLVARHLRRMLDWPGAAWRATTASLLVLLVLGYGLKDSGIAVPAVMLYVILATVGVLVAERLPAAELVATNASTADPPSQGIMPGA